MSTNSATAKRDAALDFMKGLACIGMIFAHLRVFDETDRFATAMQFAGGFAPALFFTVSGINSRPQARKYGLPFVLAFNAALFVFGTSYSHIIHADLYQRYLLEIFQIIAIGGCTIAVIERYLAPPAWVYGVLALLAFVLKQALAYLVPDFDGAGLLLTHADYVPHGQVAAGETRVWPGFPILPWLFAFFLGPFIHALGQRQLLLLWVALAALFGGLLATGLAPDWQEKWDMSPGYFLLSVLVSSGVLLLLRAVPAAWLQQRRLMLFLGNHSLAFLFIHGLGLVAATGLRSLGQVAGWAIVLAVSLMGLKLMQRWQGFGFMAAPASWAALAAVVLLLPLLAAPGLRAPVMLLQLFAGILFARHLPQLRGLLLQLTNPEPTLTDSNGGK